MSGGINATVDTYDPDMDPWETIYVSYNATLPDGTNRTNEVTVTTPVSAVT